MRVERGQRRPARDVGDPRARLDRPGDLGYFIGYRIAEAFYARTVNKREALRAIIDVSNSDLFLSQSGYAP